VSVTTGIMYRQTGGPVHSIGKVALLDRVEQILLYLHFSCKYKEIQDTSKLKYDKLELKFFIKNRYIFTA
jgi:hypothetical protein